jgi:hypothetical protein
MAARRPIRSLEMRGSASAPSRLATYRVTPSNSSTCAVPQVDREAALDNMTTMAFHRGPEIDIVDSTT